MAGGGLFDDSGGGIGGMLTGLGGAAGINLSGIPFVGGMFPNPAEAQMRQAMANATASYGAMREPAAQGYQNLMARTGAAYAPVQSALGWMYGAPQQSSPSAGTAPSPGPSPQPQQAQPAPQGGGGGGGGFLGGLGDMLGLGQKAPFGLPGPGLGGVASGNLTGNLPGMGWKGPGQMGLPGLTQNSMGLGGMPGMGAGPSLPRPSNGTLLGGPGPLGGLGGLGGLLG